MDVVFINNFSIVFVSLNLEILNMESWKHLNEKQLIYA